MQSEASSIEARAGALCGDVAIEMEQSTLTFAKHLVWYRDLGILVHVWRSSQRSIPKSGP